MTVLDSVLLGLIGLLVGFIIYQQAFFTKQVQTLVDKLMCKSFREYETTKNPPPPRVVVNNEIPDDLRVLQGIQP